MKLPRNLFRTFVVFPAMFRLLFAVSCARIADPRPPEIRVPKAVNDLTARQVSDTVILTCSLPARNTDGSPARTIRSLEIFRITEDARAEESAAPLTEEMFFSQAALILSIPSERFSEHLRNNVFSVSDAPKPAPGETLYSKRFRYAAVFMNEKRRAAGLGNQTVIQLRALPLPPKEIAADTSENEIRLRWTPSSENRDGSQPPVIEGYNVYRAESPEAFTDAPLNASPLVRAEYRDRDFRFDKTYFYAVSVVGSLQNPSAESARSEALEVKVDDVFPPNPPEDFTAVVERGTVFLFWTPSPSADVAGYRIFRINDGVLQLRRKELITGLSFRDDGVESGRTYDYEIHAIDARGNESAARTLQLTVD